MKILPNMKPLRHGQQGFTIVEILIVIAIIAILAVVIIPNVPRILANANKYSANHEVAEVKKASIAYSANHNKLFPSDSSELGDYLTLSRVKATYVFNTSDGDITDYLLGDWPVTIRFNVDTELWEIVE